MRPDREGAFALLRAERPIFWHQHDFCGAGFWALIKHADIVTVKRDASTCNSANGVHVGDQPEVLEEVSRVTRTPAYASDFCSVRAVLRDGEYYPATM